MRIRTSAGGPGTEGGLGEGETRVRGKLHHSQATGREWELLQGIPAAVRDEAEESKRVTDDATGSARSADPATILPFVWEDGILDEVNVPGGPAIRSGRFRRGGEKRVAGSRGWGYG